MVLLNNQVPQYANHTFLQSKKTANVRGIGELTRKTQVLHGSSVSSVSVSPQLTTACQCHSTLITHISSLLVMHLPNMAEQTVQ